MTLPPPMRILVAALALASVLVGLVLWEDRARAQGQEVVLAMEAVDPRSLLSGHYVALDLSERLPTGGACRRGPVSRRPMGGLRCGPRPTGTR